MQESTSPFFFSFQYEARVPYPRKSPKASSSILPSTISSKKSQAAQEAYALGNEAENIGGLAPDVRLLNRKSRNNGKKLSNCISHNG